MTDRELLEKAAMAAGVKPDTTLTNGGTGEGFDMIGNMITDWYNGTKWNPLQNDADAFRLMVDLKLDVCFLDGYQEVKAEFIASDRVIEEYQVYSEDMHAATRRAIVIAAAAMLDTTGRID